MIIVLSSAAICMAITGHPVVMWINLVAAALIAVIRESQ